MFPGLSADWTESSLLITAPLFVQGLPFTYLPYARELLSILSTVPIVLPEQSSHPGNAEFLPHNISAQGFSCGWLKFLTEVLRIVKTR